MSAGARGPCTAVSETRIRAAGKRVPDRGHEVALGRGLGAGQQPDPAREERQRALALLGEEPFRGEGLAQPLDPRGERAEADRLERERPEAERTARRVELGPAEDLDGGAVGELDPQRVERGARHRDRQARAVGADP